MRKLFYALLALILFPAVLFAQKTFTASLVSNSAVTPLNNRFKSYSLFKMNTRAIRTYAQGHSLSPFELRIDLPGLTGWDISMSGSDILSPDYKLVESSTSGKRLIEGPGLITYRGITDNDENARVSLTVTDEILYGIIESKGKEYFIEPLHYLVKGAVEDLFVVYETRDVIFDPSLTCGVTEMKKEQQRLAARGAGTNCVVTQLAIASDVSMFTRYGSAAAVATHNIGVMNNVIWDYVNAQFTNNIEFLIVTQNVSTSAATDQLSPLYTGTNSNTILTNFRNWGQAGNFAATYDIGQLWTTRDIDADGVGGNNGIIGLAYVGGVCTSFRYQLLEDFAGTNPTGSGYILRVLTAHETGHNFNANHDAAGSPFIMAPTVQNTTTWSPASIASVDGIVATATCLSTCNVSTPVAGFLANPGGICAGGTVQFIDHTLGGPTSWNWTFTGGTPATSTLRNPSVSFATVGVKTISLTVNNGTGSSSKSGTIVVSNAPTVACVNTGTGTTPTGVKSFSLNTINRNTGSVVEDGNKYLDFSCSDQTILAANTTYTADVNVGNAGTNEFNVIQMFIDYNNDGDFLDANEVIHSSPSCYYGTYSFSFTTPALPPVNNQALRLRVIAKDCFGGVNACYNVTNGQVEDYGVLFFSAVPVKLLSFDGIHLNGKNQLTWQTASEANSSHFEVERSFEGNTYHFLTRLNALNNATGNQYAVTDDLADANRFNRFFYRLKIVDEDGRFTYSNIVKLARQEKESHITVYPNPVKKGELIQVDLGTANIKSLTMVNALGQVVYRHSKENIRGNISIEVAQGWAAGQYILQLKNAEGVINIKVIVL